MAAMMSQAFEHRWRDELTVLEALIRKGEGQARPSESAGNSRVHRVEMTNTQIGFATGSLAICLLARRHLGAPKESRSFCLIRRVECERLCKLCEVFPTYEVQSCGDRLKTFAAHGFLLVDLIPFAMDYSSKRSSRRYDDLVRLTTTSYLQQKINSAALAWAPDIRVAFFVKRNARSILKAVEQLSIGGRWCPLSSQMIAVNDAGYPDADKLRDIYGLNVDKRI